MSSIEAVCFDLDSTLCLPDQSDQEIHAAVFDRAGVEPFFYPPDQRAVDSTDVETAESAAEFYTNLYRVAVEGLPADPEPSLLAELGEVTVEVVDETAVSLRPGAREAHDNARERYEVGLVTNGGKETQYAKLETLGIAGSFDVTVYCDPAAGVDPKPATEPFDRALAGLSASPETTVYVGDDHSTDVVGAHEAGLQSVWVPPNRPHESHPDDPEPAPTHRLDSLEGLPSVL
jgi:HAD superfamily hydrolase (TIGR01509 family)